eukprot:GHRR01005501.1.p1 GENE.GHRR01005501.1~~GHRR01005501.1.p1  ORF type:complete len:310 (+),score=72.49 GHRR01005501.1:1280-2209(+)
MHRGINCGCRQQQCSSVSSTPHLQLAGVINVPFAAWHSSRRPATQLNAKQNQEEFDIVTRWVGKLFGQAVIEDKEPFGLKRMDWSQVKDLEVTTDRWAEPVATDDPLAARIRPLLAGTQLEKEPLRCAFSATEDGWNPTVFHRKVDGYGAALVVARTQGGAVIGGYNPLGYDGYGPKATLGAFLFTWPDGDLSKRPFKLPKIATDQMAVVDGLDQGIHFGPGDLKILLQRGNPTRATCKLIDYKPLPGRNKSLFNKENGENPTKTELVELRVYVRKGGKLKYELDGVRWKSSYADDGSGQGPPTGIFTM